MRGWVRPAMKSAPSMEVWFSVKFACARWAQLKLYAGSGLVWVLCASGLWGVFGRKKGGLRGLTLPSAFAFACSAEA